MLRITRIVFPTPHPPIRSNPVLPLRRRLRLSSLAMAAVSEDALRKTLADAQAAVDSQADAVRALKSRPGVAKPEIAAAVDAVKSLKLHAASSAKHLQAALSANGDGPATRDAFRQAVVNTLERRLFYIPSKIHRGVAGGHLECITFYIWTGI